MKKFKYVGPSDEVEVPAAGVTVARGHQVEIHDPALAASMEEQADVWEHIPQSKPKRSPAKKAAPTSTVPAEETVAGKDAAATIATPTDPQEG